MSTKTGLVVFVSPLKYGSALLDHSRSYNRTRNRIGRILDQELIQCVGIATAYHNSRSAAEDPHPSISEEDFLATISIFPKNKRSLFIKLPLSIFCVRFPCLTADEGRPIFESMRQHGVTETLIVLPGVSVPRPEQLRIDIEYMRNRGWRGMQFCPDIVTESRSFM